MRSPCPGSLIFAIAFYTDEIKGFICSTTTERRSSAVGWRPANPPATFARGVQRDHHGNREHLLSLQGTPAPAVRRGSCRSLFPTRARFPGAGFAAGQGARTALLHAMVMEDIRRPGASLILMDGRGDFVASIRTTSRPSRSARHIDPDPEEPDRPPTRSTSRTPVSPRASTCQRIPLRIAVGIQDDGDARRRSFRSVAGAGHDVSHPTLQRRSGTSLTNSIAKYDGAHQEAAARFAGFFSTTIFRKELRRYHAGEYLHNASSSCSAPAGPCGRCHTAARTRFPHQRQWTPGRIVVIGSSARRDQGAGFSG